MKIIIIGASFAGIYCSLQARKLYPDAEILLIEKKELVGFLPNGLLLYLQGFYDTLEEATFISSEMLKQKNISVHLEETFIEALPNEKSVVTDKGNYTYDKLVLATGSSQHSKNIDLAEEEIYHYKTYSAAKKLLPKIETAQNITIVGAGQAGLEAASVFVELGKKVNVFETMDYPLFKYFDKDFLVPFLTDIQQIENLHLQLSQQISKVDKNDQFEVNFQQQQLKSDLILTTVNVHPTLVNLPVKRHRDLTVETNDYLETSIKDIFAVGDLIQVPLTITKEKMYLPQISNAVRTGLVAAENLASPRKKFQGSLRMIGTKLFHWYLASAGLLEAEAFLYPKKIGTKLLHLPAALVAGQSVDCKLIFEEESRRLLGVQLLSKVNCLETINRYGWAIEQQMTVEQLLEQDFFFHSQFSNRLSFTNEFILGSDTDEI